MDSDESPRQHKRRAIAGFFCCCCFPCDIPEPDSRAVRITAGIVAFVAMLVSGIGFSALQMATVNPYVHVFNAGSSSRQHISPIALGPAFAPAPAPFTLTLLQPFGGLASAEGIGAASAEQLPVTDQIGQPAVAPSNAVDGTGTDAVFAPGSGQLHTNSLGSISVASPEAPSPALSMAAVESAPAELNRRGSPQSSLGQLGSFPHQNVTGTPPVSVHAAVSSYVSAFQADFDVP